MAGLFGLGLGVAVMWAEIRSGSWIVSLLIGVGYWLVFRMGRRASSGTTAVAVATATAVAKSESLAASQSNVQVNLYVHDPRSVVPERATGLDAAPWLTLSDDDRSGQRSIEAQFASAAGELGADEYDDDDPMQVLARAQLPQPGQPP